MIKLRVYGIPAPQGSKSAFALRKGGQYTGRAVVVDDNKGPLRAWRADVIGEAHRAMDAQLADWHKRDRFCRATEFGATIVFMLARPQAHLGTGRNAATVRPGAPKRPAGKRDDLDKLARSTLDALTAAGVWGDDGQVVDLNLSKVYAAPGEAPGAVIEITWEG